MPKKSTKKRTPVAPLAVPGSQRVDDLRAAKEEWVSRMPPRPELPPIRAFTVPVTPDPIWNVQGVGIGEKTADGRHTGVLAVKFLVRAKFHRRHLSRKHTLPKSIAGLPTDVEEVGLFRRFQGDGDTPVPDPRTSIRPAPPGCSVGFLDPTNGLQDTGTFGALVQDANGAYILSCNHVLADENRLPLGSPIFQPSLPDGGSPTTDQIAQLTRFKPLDPTAANQADCAIAQVPDPSQVSNQILQIGAPQGFAEPEEGILVRKFGRATHLRVGRIDTVHATVFLPYLTATYRFDGQFTIIGLDGDIFSDAGDSGALVLENGSNVAVGLILAGSSGPSSSHSVASPISNVLQALGVTLA